MIPSMLLPWQTFLLLGLLFNVGLICCLSYYHKACSLLVSSYRDLRYYGQRMCFKSDHLPILLCLTMQKGTENDRLPWQHLNGCHFVSYLMYITPGAKFEYHYSNIFGNILNFGIYYCKVYDVINFSTKT